MTMYPTIYDGELVTPNMRGWTQVCCRCGLRHRFTFKVVRQGNRNTVMFRARRVR